MSTEVTIPALPSTSITETLEFYEALGFVITYQQKRPNTYGCVKRGDIELHFFSMKGIDPANSYSTCLILTPDVNALYQSFADGLRQHFGKLPVAGIPRITKPSNKNAAGDYRFNVVDPSGNYIRIIQPAEKAESIAPDADEKSPLTKLGRAIKSADLIANARGDFAAATSVLDKALVDTQADTSPAEQVQATILRAEIALNMGDKPLAARCLADVSQIILPADVQNVLKDDLQKMKDLAQLLD